MDLLQPHIDAGLRPSVLSPDEARAAAREIDLAAPSGSEAAARIEEALALLRKAPDCLAPQLLAATLMERARQRADMLDTWTGLSLRFPDCILALRYRLRWLGREGRSWEAMRLLEERFDEMVAAGGSMEREAELYAELRDADAVDRMFRKLIAHEPDNIRIRVVYGKTLFARGDVVGAFDMLDPLRGENLSPTAREVLERNDRAILAMESIEENSSFRAAGAGSVLRTAIAMFRHREVRAVGPDRIGGIRLYTGSLGPGGAERQMTQLAELLHHRVAARRNVRGCRIDGPVDVLVNSIDNGPNKDHFRPALERAGVAFSVAQSAEKMPQEQIAEAWPEFGEIYPLLPRNARFGMEQIFPGLAAADPDVFFIWQDGAVLTGALAALAAGVPRIAISLRGLPPSLRPHLMKPEYLDMYQALAEIPGVSFSCNSSIAADAYSDWLDLPRDRFSVIYNAVQELPSEGLEADEALWSAFEAATPDATLTLGGVFRFTPNKRGLLWIEWAAALAERHPQLRFVLVGDGVELEAARLRARTLGIADRVLFTGASSTVGYWLSKMDVLSLLSENEGLPNTLIEAQVAGVPVIATPAGGAAETMLHGRTGYLMSSAEEPSFDEYAMFFDMMLTGRPGLAEMGRMAQVHARARFDIEHVLAQTVRFLLGERVEASDEAGLANVTAIPAARGRDPIDAPEATYARVAHP